MQVLVKLTSIPQRRALLETILVTLSEPNARARGQNFDLKSQTGLQALASLSHKVHRLNRMWAARAYVKLQNFPIFRLNDA